MNDVIRQLQQLIEPCAAKFEAVPEHWIHGWDEGLSFCRECAEKKVEELLAAEPDKDYLVDGGWGSEGDSQAFCETCGRALDNPYTDYATEMELDHFEEYGFDINAPEDCHALLECTYALGSGNEELQQRLAKLALSIIQKAAAMTDDQAMKRLDRDIAEQARLRALSNEDLVRECLSYPSYDDADLHVEELMTRVWPGWKDQWATTGSQA